MSENVQIRTRIEKDSVGTLEVPVEAYYGIHSLRARENFPMTGRLLPAAFIENLVKIKRAAAITNRDGRILKKDIADAIICACEEIEKGALLDQFIVDPIEGGAGTSMNMNANEVIANRAIELLGGRKGDYSIVHPNDHVNAAQSTNDVIPTAGKMTALCLLKDLESEMRLMFISLLEKAIEFQKVIKMGRTQLQDAVPVTLGQEFEAYADAVRRSLERIIDAEHELRVVNLGGTAIGTGINTDSYYFRNVVPKLSELFGSPLSQADNLIDSTQNIDCFAAVSGTLKTAATALSKIANDLRLLSSGPKTGIREILLPDRQNGSSIMPGKINPVIPEVVSQAAFRVIGNDMTITMAVEAGQLELNAFEPVIFDALFESITLLTHALHTFRLNCVNGIEANEAGCLEKVMSSTGVVTAVCSQIGYQKASEIAKASLKTGTSVRELILKEGLIPEKELDALLNIERMTRPDLSERK